MMKPKFDDVLEYVRGDENDPAMRDLLQSYPDGAELLKQARFIIAAMGGKPKSGFAKPPAMFGLDDMLSASRAEEAADLSAPEPAVFDAPRRMSESLTFYQGPAGRGRGRGGRPSIRQRLLRNAGRETEKLGTLNLERSGDEVALSYDPSESTLRRYGKPLSTGLMKLGDLAGIDIQGKQATVSLPETVAAGKPIRIRVARYLKKQPSQYMEIIFMPETGPFYYIRTDAEGVAELPAPEQDGTLRFAGTPPQLLDIKIKK